MADELNDRNLPCDEVLEDRYKVSGKSVAFEHRIILGYYQYHALQDQMR